MYCRTCGNNINDHAEICVKCGCKPLIGKSYCQNCGASTTEQQEMCTQCGAMLKSIAIKDHQLNGGKRILGKFLKVFGIILLALTILRTFIGFASGEFSYDLIYYPEYFLTEDMGMALICLVISVIFLVLGKRLNQKNKKSDNISNNQTYFNVSNNLNVDNTITDSQPNLKFDAQSDNRDKNFREMSTIETNEAVNLPEQTQNKQPQTTSNIPPQQIQSILDERKLLDDIKAMPVKWEFHNPSALENRALQELCMGFFNHTTVLKILSPEMIQQMEYLIQKKRARTSIRENYGEVMNRNILYELYEYSYLMNIFNVLEQRRNDIIQIDRVEFWTLIQDHCHKRIENLEQEKRNNPGILNIIKKYELDTQKVKMIVNDYVEPREYDYIYASLMTMVLLEIISNLVLGGEIKIGNNYQPTLQVIRQYSANDLIAALDTHIASRTHFALGIYANGGALPSSNH